jgi:hypothetical protein
MTKNGKLTVLDRIINALGSDALNASEIQSRMGGSFTKQHVSQEIARKPEYFEKVSRGVYKVAGDMSASSNPLPIKEMKKPAKVSSKKKIVPTSASLLLTDEEKRVKEEIKALTVRLKKIERAKSCLD